MISRDLSLIEDGRERLPSPPCRAVRLITDAYCPATGAELPVRGGDHPQRLIGREHHPDPGCVDQPLRQLFWARRARYRELVAADVFLVDLVADFL